MAYWITPGILGVLEDNTSLGDVAEAKQGLSTGDHERFVRNWHEVSFSNTGFGIEGRKAACHSNKKWVPLNKGGAFRKWIGNQEYVINWYNDGKELRDFKSSVLRNSDYYFMPSISWSDVTISHNSFRYFGPGFIHTNVGHSAFAGDDDWKMSLLSYCNTKFVGIVTKLLSPTVHFDVGYFNKLPYAERFWTEKSREVARTCISLASSDWDSFETSWNFQSHSLLPTSAEQGSNLESSYATWTQNNRDNIVKMKRLEEENNLLFIEAHGLQEELSPEVPIEQITLTVNPAYRYGVKLSEAEREDRFRQDTMRELVSYAIGCMMGRYSLDAPGIIYAHAGGEGFDPSRYTTFAADEDGIIPLTDTEWFEDDATARLIEFIGKAWPSKGLEANLNFLAENLGPKKNEGSRETLRRYLSDGFYKDHMQTYKKRPIYWLFTSGKHKAFQALVYLHRYNPGTLSRMRTKYVLPLMGKLDATIHRLDAGETLSTKDRKELDQRKKQLAELKSFDEKLHHLADQRIALDLDDGVKVNYGKFSTPQGEILAEVPAITGEKKKKKGQ